METTLAQVAHEILGVHPAKVRVVHGDTALTPYSTGTWGSRAMVMAGGAVAEACRQLGDRAPPSVRAAAGPAADVEVLRGGAGASLGDGRRRRHRRGRPHLVPRAAEPAGRRRQGRAGGHGRLPAGSRYRHASYACHAVRGAGRHRDRRRRARGLRGRRGWRHAGEPDDRRRPGAGRHCAGHRHRPVRGDAVRRARASRWRRRWRTICCPARPTCPTSGSTTWRRRAPGPPSARRASARAARSARRRRSSTPSTTRWRRSGAEVSDLPATPARVLAAIAAARAQRK